jgi:DNA-directed RNA polymerase sigma subunit (sigma70/sigma32)
MAPVTYTSSEEEGGASIREFTDPSTVSPEDEVAMEESLRNIENLLRERLADKADSHILVMSLMATDSTPSEIAEELGISRQQAQTMMKTVRTTLADLRPE